VLISDTDPTDVLQNYQLDLFAGTVQGSVYPLENISYTSDLETSVTISGLTLDTTLAPYVFNNSNPGNANNSYDLVSNPGYVYSWTSPILDPGSPNELDYVDAANSGTALLNSTYALAEVQFTVAAGFVGTIYLNWNGDNLYTDDGSAPFYTLASDPSTQLVPTLVGGQINVVPIPEPATSILLAMGAIGLLCRHNRHNRYNPNRLAV
jgi:hypothetical protein